MSWPKPPALHNRAFLQNPSAYAGQNVVLLMTGANIPLEVIRRAVV